MTSISSEIRSVDLTFPEDDKVTDQEVVVISGLVFTDGLGDLHHMLSAAKYVQELYPKARVVIGAEVMGLARRKDRFSNINALLQTPDELSSQSKTHFYVWDMIKAMRKNSESDNQIISEFKKDVLAASVIVEVSANQTTCVLEEMAEKIASKPRIRLPEFQANSLRSNGKSREAGSMWSPAIEGDHVYELDMGFHAEESGVFWPRPMRADAQVETLISEKLRPALLSGTPHGEVYKDSNILHFAYFSPKELHELDWERRFVSFNFLADCKDRRPNIDFVMPMPPNSDGSSCLSWLPPSEKLEGTVKEIIFTDPLSADSPEVIYRGSGTKTVRFIKAPYVNKEDFRTILQVSEGVVGCTGDNSLVEAIASGNPWLYETRKFKNAVLDDLKYLACEFFKDNLGSPFLNYLLMYRNEELSDSDINLISACIAHPNMKKDAKAFSEYLKEKKDIRPEFAARMERIVHHKPLKVQVVSAAAG